MSWPAAERRAVDVENAGVRPWDDASPRRIKVVQTIPALIADLPLPVLRDDQIADAFEAAHDAVAALTRQALVAGLPQLGHLVAVLIRSDAVASSRIEQVRTTSEALAVALADLDETGDAIVPADASETWLVAGAVEAVQSAIDTRPGNITDQWLTGLHRGLLRHDREITPRHLGAWRDCVVWIGETRQHAEFEGPPYELIPVLVADLLAFTARHDVPPLAKAAIAHAQFETIHPFVDGNGRVGRALVHSLIGSPEVPVPVAHGLLSDLSGYVAGLAAYRAGGIGEWLATFAIAVERGATAAVGLIQSLDKLRAHYRRSLPTRTGSVTRQLLDDLIGQPVVTALMLQRRYGISAPRASQLTTQLVDAEILRRSSAWAPTTRRVWVAPDVLAAIDAIGEQLPRSPG